MCRGFLFLDSHQASFIVYNDYDKYYGQDFSFN